MSGTRTDFFNFEISSIGAIWFLPAMVWATIALYCMVKFIPDSRAGHCLRIAVTAVLFLIGYLTEKITWLPFSVQSGLTAVVFIYAGYFVKNYLPEGILKEKWKKVIALAAACILWGLDWYYGLPSSMYIVVAHFPHIILNIAGALSAIYVIFMIVEHTIRIKWLSRVYRYLDWMGRNTMAALCFHLIELKFIPWSAIFACLVPALPVIPLVLAARILWASVWICIVNRTKKLRMIFT